MIIITDLQATSPTDSVPYLVRVRTDGDKVSFELPQPVNEFTVLSSVLRELLIRTKPNKSLP